MTRFFVNHGLVAVVCLAACHVTVRTTLGHVCGQRNAQDTEWWRGIGLVRLACGPSTTEADSQVEMEEHALWTSLLQMEMSALERKSAVAMAEASDQLQKKPGIQSTPSLLYDTSIEQQKARVTLSVEQKFMGSLTGAFEQAQNLYFDPFGGGGLRKILGHASPIAASKNANFTGVGTDIVENPDEVMRRVQDTWTKDMFPAHSQKLDGDEGLNFFKSAPPMEWFILGSTCTVLSFVDLFILQRLPDTFAVHCSTLVFWICMAMAFCTMLWYRTSQTMALDWFTGYVLEWILSMDKLFVFHLVLATYKTPPKLIHKAVFIGIIGAVLIRMAFFMVVSTLLHISYWIRLPFGMLLIWSGIEAARGGDDDDDPEALKETFMVRSMRYLLGQRLIEGYDEKNNRMFILAGDGRLQVTLLFFVVLCLEATDVLFALDSVSAKVAQIPDQYIAFSSSVLAMYGLRAMFFIVKDLVEMFELLQYGLCLILVFIGIELILANYIHLASTTVCILIVSVFGVCITGSAAVKCGRGRAPSSPHGNACNVHGR